MARLKIRFNGDSGSWYFIKLGPISELAPKEREFQGGVEAEVVLFECAGKPDVVDMTFEDGEQALEVPREFFSVVP